jgi:hypothetical protein
MDFTEGMAICKLLGISTDALADECLSRNV